MTKSNKFLLLALILTLLFICAHSQRGGSRSSSKSSSSSRSSYRHHSYGSHSNENCTTVNGTTTCSYVDEPLSWTSIGIFVAVFAAFLGIGIFSSQKDEKRRKETIEKVMKEYDQKIQESPSQVDLPQRDAMIDAFMKKSYTMVIDINDKAEKFYCQVKVLNLKKINDYKYSIQFSGSDTVGTSKMEGVLIFKGTGIGLKLSKVYDDRTKAEQTGKYDILLYEGEGDVEKMEGNWAFYGFQSSTEYAGKWKMLDI